MNDTMLVQLFVRTLREKTGLALYVDVMTIMEVTRDVDRYRREQQDARDPD